jgi:predicted component of type VI protein secretion system
MRAFWEQRLEDLHTATQYAERQLGRVVLAGLEQMAIPIEALLDEISDEEAANVRWGVEEVA